ncbi:MAG: hypothetical protein ACTHNS_07260 [Marmoricola sp.]
MTTLTTPSKRSRTARPAARPTAELAQELRCSCGQELDCCESGYCPRCGHVVAQRP